MKFDDIMTRDLGEFGRYQKVLFIFVCAPCMIAAMQALVWSFSAADLPHRCRLDWELENATYQTLNPIGLEKTCENCPKFKSCWLNGTSECPYGYVYDHTEIKKSAIDEWNLVCDRGWIKAFVQSTYYIGQAIGSIVFGFMGDRFGRKKVVIIAICLVLIAGFGMVKPVVWWVYALWRTLAGMSHPGISNISLLIGTELVGPSGRRFGSLMSGLFFAMGHCLLVLLAYFIRDFEVLQLAIAIIPILVFVYYWFIPESPRWLVSQRRYKEANEILKEVAIVNKTQLAHDWAESVDEALEDKAVRRYNLFHLFKSPKILCRILAMFFVWPVVSMVYYGVSMNPNFLGGNLYIAFALGAIVELPAILMMYSMIDRVGRKKLICCGFLMCVVALLSNWAIPESAYDWISISQFLITKSAIALTMNSLYTYTPELFPTVLRATASLGCSMMARIGAVSASFIMMWLVEKYSKLVVIIPFSLLSLISAIVVWFFLPETMGGKLPESIEDIEE